VVESGWEAMRQFLARVAVGPSGSRDLDRGEACRAMRLCLDRQATDVQIGVFLIAERLKRESDEEVLGFFDALLETSQVISTRTRLLVSIADPYDGYNRTAHFAPATAATLAALGVPTLLHGVEHMPPKYGTTARQVLRAGGHTLDVGGGVEALEAAAKRLDSQGLAYVGLEDFNPKLHALTQIRREIAKRSTLATLEKLITPIRGRRQTHVVAGWVHAGYDQLMCRVLQSAGIESGFLLNGREGHTDPHLHRETPLCSYHGEEAVQKHTVSPADVQLRVDEPLVSAGTSPEAMAAQIQAVLSGAQGGASDTVAFSAALILRHVGVFPDLSDGFERARRVLSNGKARDVYAGFSV